MLDFHPGLSPGSPFRGRWAPRSRAHPRRGPVPGAARRGGGLGARGPRPAASRPIAALLPGPGRRLTLPGRRRDVDNTQTRDVGAWFPWKRNGDVIASPSHPPAGARVSRAGGAGPGGGRGAVATAAGAAVVCLGGGGPAGRGLRRPRPPYRLLPTRLPAEPLGPAGPGQPRRPGFPPGRRQLCRLWVGRGPSSRQPHGRLGAPSPCAGRARAGNLSREMGPGLKIMPLRRWLYF